MDAFLTGHSTRNLLFLAITPMTAITQKPWHPVVLPGEDPELIARLGRPMPTGVCLPALAAMAARGNGRNLPARVM
jgi:hypothetical protein